MEKIHDVSKIIVSEILQRPNLESQDLENLIYTRIKQSLFGIIMEYQNIEDAEYLRLLTEQQKHRVGTMMYNEIGQKLSIAKHKKAAANRITNNIKRVENFEDLRKYVYSKFGDEAMNDYYDERRAKREN